MFIIVIMDPKEGFIDLFEDLIFVSGFNSVPTESIKEMIKKDNFSFLCRYGFITENEANKLKSFASNYNSVRTDIIKKIIKSVFERLNLTNDEKNELMLKIKEDFETFINAINLSQKTSYNTFIYVLSVINLIYELFDSIIIPTNIGKIVRTESKNNTGLYKIYNTLNSANTNPNENKIVINENAILISPIVESKVNSYLIEKSVIYASYCLKKTSLFNEKEM